MRLLFFCLILLAGPAAAQDRLANNLAGAQSPYLLQHQFNPVDWYPWGEESLTRARTENKLIFLSVGYSSCHWCHVMADESFEDDVIAEFLNEHFVSIKIDRERRPDLDEQFMLATQMLTGGGGWPNSVFLTPSGDPFFGGTYFPPEQFLQLLHQIVDIWQSEPQELAKEGKLVSERLRNFMTRKARAEDLSPDVVRAVAKAIVDRTDPFGGGLGDTAKFPRESLFLFLLDQAERTGDPEILAGVTNMLDAMIRGGIHDHVGGGFHRYAVDPDWRVPHFEKMLYNQAMTGRLLVRSWRVTGLPAYRRAAERLFDYVLRDMRGPSGGFIAAEDADSDDGTGTHVEGAFYTWKYGDLDAHFSDLEQYFDISAPGDLEGANVLNLIDDTVNLARQLDMSEPELFTKLDPLLFRMLESRTDRIRPGVDAKILMGWNGAMIATLAEAGHVFERPDYVRAAANAANHILTQMRGNDGFYRVWFDGRAGTPAQLADYGGFGMGLLALHDFDPEAGARALWLDQALVMANQIRTRFGDPRDGFRMNQKSDGFSPVIPLDDSDIQSGNALAMDLFAGLAKRMQAPEMALNATRLAGAMSGHALEAPEQRGATLTASQNLQFGEVGPIRHVASGAVRVAMVNLGDYQVRFDLTVAEGWHLNAHEPLEDYFIPFTLTLGGIPLSDEDYPTALIKSLGFNPKPLALYENEISLQGQLNSGEAVLTLQACNDEICLQPEELRFRIWNQ